MTASRIGGEVEEINAITSRLTQKKLAETNTYPATKAYTGQAEMEATIRHLSQAGLEEIRVEGGADEEENGESPFLPQGPVSEEAHQWREAQATVKQKETDV